MLIAASRSGSADRGRAERRVLRLGTALAAAFLAAAAVSLAVLRTPSGWTALHLALAGAATLAIGTFMPHFAVTLAGTEAEPAPLRIAVLGLLAAGCVLAVVGISVAADRLAAVGGGVLVGGIAGTAWVAFGPLRRGIARRHPVVHVTYGVALADVTVGASLAVAYLAGWEPVAAGWVRLKPAHAWLNLLGFVSLTVAATLVYLAPTVTGTRIRPHPALVVLVGGLTAGPPLVAIGAWLGSVAVALAGGLLTLAGTLGLLGYLGDVLRRRGRWTTDPGWHRLVIGHLAAAVPWYAAAVFALVVGIAIDGPTPPGWTIGSVAVPLVGGWVLQALIGSASHLVPAVGPGGVEAHARQRRILGRWSTVRLVAWNGGLLIGWPALAAGVAPLALVGGLLWLAAMVSALGLLVAALR